MRAPHTAARGGGDGRREDLRNIAFVVVAVDVLSERLIFCAVGHGVEVNDGRSGRGNASSYHDVPRRSLAEAAWLGVCPRSNLIQSPPQSPYKRHPTLLLADSYLAHIRALTDRAREVRTEGSKFIDGSDLSLWPLSSRGRVVYHTASN